MPRLGLILLAGVLAAAAAVALRPPAALVDSSPPPRPASPEPEDATARAEQGTSAPEAEPGVFLEVGTDLQAAVDAQPPGTTFVLGAGIHRLQMVHPRDGDRFVGSPGAILSGARVLPTDGFVPLHGRWVLTGQEQEGTAYPSDPRDRMLPGHFAEERPEELFAGGARLRKVDTPDELGQGRWYFDYDGDRIILHDDPASLGELETSVTAHAFIGDSTGVSISNLVVRHYANPSQRGAIDGDEGVDWTVEAVHVHDNHAVGVRLGRGGVMTGSRLADNGQMGLIVHGYAGAGGEDGRGVVIEGNEITGNKALGYDPAWEGGATKIIRTAGGVFRQNWVHANGGYGFWFDIDNIDARIESNLVEGNELVGLFYEISKDALIRWNVSRENGVHPSVRGRLLPDNSALHVSSSTGVTVEGNALSAEGGFAFVATTEARRFDDPTSRLGGNEVADLLVIGNDLDLSDAAVGVLSDTPVTFTDREIRFAGNRYRTDRRSRFLWDGRSLTRPERWLSRVAERDAEVLNSDGTARLPADALPFSRGSYGPG